MKKILLISLTAFLSIFQGNAQCEAQQTLNEDFEGITALSEICWTSSHPAPYFSIDGGKVQAYSFFAGTADLFLVSPEITELTGNTLTFSAAKINGDPTIQVGTLETVNGYGTFTAIGDLITLTSTETEYTVEIPASEHKFIAFKYNGTGTHQAGTIDNIVLEVANPCAPSNTINQNFDAASVLADVCWASSHPAPYFSIDGGKVQAYSFFAGTADLFLVSPELAEIDGNNTLIFSAAKINGDPTIQVGTLETVNGYGTFTAIGDLITLTSTETEYAVEIPASDHKFIAFKYNGAGTHQAGTIDNVTYQATASVNVTESANFKIYPNPTSSVLNIQGNQELKSVAIFDISGRNVLTSTLNSIDVSSLNNGVYILKITSDKGISESKFIKK